MMCFAKNYSRGLEHSPPRFVHLFVTKYFLHAFHTLLRCKNFVAKGSVFVCINNEMLWSRYQAMLNATIPAEAFLVCAGVEESHIKLFTGRYPWHKNLVGINVRIIKILAVAR